MKNLYAKWRNEPVLVRLLTFVGVALAPFVGLWLFVQAAVAAGGEGLAGNMRFAFSGLLVAVIVAVAGAVVLAPGYALGRIVTSRRLS